MEGSRNLDRNPDQSFRETHFRNKNDAECKVYLWKPALVYNVLR